jgi:hypothetical protein
MSPMPRLPPVPLRCVLCFLAGCCLLQRFVTLVQMGIIGCTVSRPTASTFNDLASDESACLRLGAHITNSSFLFVRTGFD